MDRKTQLNIIIKGCEKRFNRGDSKEWKHSDFNDFSSEILKETKTNISSITLKRIFGKIPVDQYYQPQQATIQALAQYSQCKLNKNNNNLNNYTSNKNLAHRIFFNKKNILLVTALIVALVFTLYFSNYRSSNKTNLSFIKLANTEGLLPKTALFDIELPKELDSVYIDFGDKSPPTYLLSDQKKISHTYLFPGVFNINIKKSEQFLAKTKIYVASNKWLGLGFYRQREIPNDYYAFPAEKKGKDSIFHIPNLQLQKAGLDTINSYFTRLCNFTPVNHLSDNFIFETTLKKQTQNKGISCSSIKFQISGIENMIRFNFVNSGCSSRVINVLSEQYFYGSKNNLTKFVLDLNKWNKLKLINRNKNLKLFVNDTLLFQGKYQKSLGDLRGVFVEFEGNGYVKKCQLTTLEGKEIYNF